MHLRMRAAPSLPLVRRRCHRRPGSANRRTGWQAWGPRVVAALRARGLRPALSRLKPVPAGGRRSSAHRALALQVRGGACCARRSGRRSKDHIVGHVRQHGHQRFGRESASPVRAQETAGRQRDHEDGREDQFQAGTRAHTAEAIDQERPRNGCERASERGGQGRGAYLHFGFRKVVVKDDGK